MISPTSPATAPAASADAPAPPAEASAASTSAPGVAGWTEPAHPLWRRLLLVCAVATALPLWATEHLPFTDLPQHVAAIAALRHWWDPVWRTQDYFTLALSQTQYLLYYLVGAVLAVPLGTAERANLVLLSLTAIAFPYSLRALLRALGLDERLAFFACVLFWSQALLIGFFNYVAAMPLLLWGLALAVRNAEQPTREGGRQSRKPALKLALLAVALFYLHLSAFIFFAPAAALASLLLPRPLDLRARLREAPRRLLWAAPVVLLGLFWLAYSPVVHPHSVGWDQPVGIQFEEPAQALKNLTDALLDIWHGSQDEWCLLALLAAAALLSWPQPRAGEEPAKTWRRGIAAAWVALAVLLYFAFPNAIGWLWQLNERYALVFALLAPLLLRPARGLRGAAPLLLVAATALFAAGNSVVQMRSFESEVGPFDTVLSAALPGKRLFAMMYDQNSRFAKFSPFLHFGSYYRARAGGVVAFSFAELPQSPFRYRPENEPPRKPARWEWGTWRYFNNQVDGVYYDYVLVHGLVDPFAQHPSGPAWHVLAQQGSWALYAKGDPKP